MKRFVFGLIGSMILIAALASAPARAADCSSHEPYYSKMDSDGSILADIFLLPGTLIVSGMAHAADPLDGGEASSKAWCVPKAQIKGIKKKAPRIAKGATRVIQNF